MVIDNNKENARMTEEDPPSGALPVTILSGFLGSGKTTLLKHILESKDHNLKVAIIVNDMAELNIDSSLIEQSGLVQAKKEIVSLQNGCICCTLRGDLIREIARIQSLKTFDYVVIESTGIAEPQNVAESFCADPVTAELAESQEQMLWTQARLDTCVTVIDAHAFPRHMASLKRFKDEFKDGLDESIPGNEEGHKSIANLLVEQVEFANTILLNKTDLISNEEQESTRKMIHALNPKAKIIATQYGVVDLSHILNTRLFNMAEAEESPGWLVSLKSKTVVTEADEYGVTSFIYRARKPFHPRRLFEWVTRHLHFVEDWNQQKKATRSQESDERNEMMLSNYGCVLRSKGFCWLAGRDSLMGAWAQSGRLLALHPMTPWYATLAEEDWEVQADEEKEAIQANFEGEHGDRRQEIVFIGIQLKPESITDALNACLLTEDELQDHSYFSDGRYYDCLPAWVVNYDAPGVLTSVLRPGQSHKFTVEEGLEVALSNLALNLQEDAQDGSTVVKVWLDQYEDRRSTLLAILRSNSCEQYPLSLKVCSTGEDGHVTLRVTLSLAGNKRKNDAKMLSEGVEVHVAGSIAIKPEGSMEEEDKEEHEESCNHEDMVRESDMESTQE